jgi:hypothetical protein
MASDEASIDQELRNRLLALAARDAEMRARLAEDGSLFQGYHPAMHAVHEENAAVLEAIIAVRGWPSESLAGADGAEAAWLILQHAIGLPDFQRRGLALLTEAAGRGEVPVWQPAYLDDRIRSLEGRPQLYGTQFDWDEQGLMSPLPIERSDNVDRRRAEIGLPPLAEATTRHRRDSPAEHRPKNLAERRREMQEWALKTGWRAPPPS